MENFDRQQEKLSIAINQDKIVLEGIQKKIDEKTKELKDIVDKTETNAVLLSKTEKDTEKMLIQLNGEIDKANKELEKLKTSIEEKKAKLKSNIKLEEEANDKKLLLEKEIIVLQKNCDSLSEKKTILLAGKDALIKERNEIKAEKIGFENENKTIFDDTKSKSSELNTLKSNIIKATEKFSDVLSSIETKEFELKNLQETKITAEKETLDAIAKKDKAVADAEEIKERLKDKNISIANRELLLRQKEQEIRYKCKEFNIPYVEGMEPLPESKEVAKLKEELASISEKEAELKRKEREIRQNCKRAGVPYSEGEIEEDPIKEQKIVLKKKEMLLDEKERELKGRCEVLRIPFDDTDVIDEAASDADKLKDIRLGLANKEFLFEEKEKILRGKYKELNLPYI